MTFNFLGPGLTVNVEAKVKEQIILDSSDLKKRFLRLIFQSLRKLSGSVQPCSPEDKFHRPALEVLWRISQDFLSHP